MNRKLFSLFCLSLAVLTASLLPASPVRSNSGGAEVSHIEDSAPVNLWSWPTEKTQINYIGPSSVWTPIVGVWYDGASNTGNFRNSGPYCEFGEDWVNISAKSPSGSYSNGCFLYLEPGDYSFSCLTDLAGALSFAFYKAVNGGFQYSHRVSYYWQTEWQEIITVPEECPLVLVWFLPPNNQSMIVTNIEIYRID